MRCAVGDFLLLCAGVGVPLGLRGISAGQKRVMNEVMDEDSYVRFFGRDDDVITSAGYRIGPGPIESTRVHFKP
jgi:hypothetical protein